MQSKRSKGRQGLMLALSLFLWQPVIAGVPLSVGGDGQKAPTLAPLLKQLTPSIVNIAVRRHVAAQPNPLLDDPFFQRFFGAPEQQQPRKRGFRATGSSPIVDAAEGYITTNNHAVKNAERT